MNPSAYPKDEDPSLTVGSLERHAPHRRAAMHAAELTGALPNPNLALGHQVGHPEALTELRRARLCQERQWRHCAPLSHHHDRRGHV